MNCRPGEGRRMNAVSATIPKWLIYQSGMDLTAIFQRAGLLAPSLSERQQRTAALQTPFSRKIWKKPMLDGRVSQLSCGEDGTRLPLGCRKAITVSSSIQTLGETGEYMYTQPASLGGGVCAHSRKYPPAKPRPTCLSFHGEAQPMVSFKKSVSPCHLGLCNSCAP